MATHSASDLAAALLVVVGTANTGCTEAAFPSGVDRDAMRRAAVDERLSRLGTDGALPLHGTFEVAENCAPEAPLEIDLGGDETLVWAEPMVLLRGMVDWVPAGLEDLESRPTLDQPAGGALDVILHGLPPMLADGTPAFAAPSTGFLMVVGLEPVPADRPQIICGSRAFAGGWTVWTFYDDNRYLKYHTQEEVEQMLEAQYSEHGPPRIEPWDNALTRHKE